MEQVFAVVYLISLTQLILTTSQFCLTEDKSLAFCCKTERDSVLCVLFIRKVYVCVSLPSHWSIWPLTAVLHRVPDYQTHKHPYTLPNITTWTTWYLIPDAVHHRRRCAIGIHEVYLYIYSKKIPFMTIDVVAWFQFMVRSDVPLTDCLYMDEKQDAEGFSHLSVPPGRGRQDWLLSWQLFMISQMLGHLPRAQEPYKPTNPLTY